MQKVRHGLIICSFCELRENDALETVLALSVKWLNLGFVHGRNYRTNKTIKNLTFNRSYVQK
jgi:hypothetical protein